MPFSPTEVSTDDPEYKYVMRKITEIVGKPKNYGLSPAEQEEEDKKKKEERRQRLAMENAERKQRNEVALAEMTAQYEQWVSSGSVPGGGGGHNSKYVKYSDFITQQKNLAEVKSQEEELKDAHALPLRNYLMKNVIPSLSEALLDCSKVKPEDPINFLVLPHFRAHE